MALRHKIATLTIFSLLVIQLLTILPISPVERAYAEPLTESGSAITRSKTYTWKELGTTKTTTIELRAETNGTVVFSRDSSEVFRIQVPSALVGNTALFSNSTYIAVNLTSSIYFIKQKWKTDGANFKLEICWNLPFAVSLRLPLSKISKFKNYILTVGNSTLDFDWNDAVRQGFIPDFENATSSIRVSIPATGCLDPLISTSTVIDVLKFANNGMWYQNSRWWVVLLPSVSPTLFQYYSSANSGTTWSGGADIDACCTSPTGSTSVFFNGTHAIIGLNKGSDITDAHNVIMGIGGSNGTLHNKIRGIPDENAAIGGDISVVIDTKGLSYDMYNVTSFVWRCPAHDIKIANCNPWTQIGGVAIFTSPQGGAMFNLTSQRVGMTASESNVLKMRIYHNSNSSLGTKTTISGTLSAGRQWDCVDFAGSTKLACVTIESGVLKFYTWDGSSVSSSTTVAYPGAVSGSVYGNRGVAITKESGTDRLIVLRIDTATGQIKWNRTNTNQAFTDSGTISGTTGQTSPNHLSTVRRANSTGYIGVLWRNASASPFNANAIIFQAFPPITTAQLTLTVVGRNAETLTSNWGVRCREEFVNGTVSFVSATGSSVCVSRVPLNEQIRISIVFSSNNTAGLKSFNAQAGCCVNKWNTTISADSSVTVYSDPTTISLRTEKASRTQTLTPDWCQIYFRVNGTTKNMTGSQCTSSFLMPNGNLSNVLHKVSKFGASLTTKPNIKNSSQVTLNATTTSQVFEIITQDVVVNGVFHKSSYLVLAMGGATCASWAFTAPNGSSLTITTSSYETINGTHTLSAITCGTIDVKSNATTWNPSSNGQTFSYKVNVFRISITKVYSVDRSYTLNLFRYAFTNANNTASNLTSTQYASFEIFGTSFTPTRAKSNLKSGNVNMNVTAITVSADVSISIRINKGRQTLVAYFNDGVSRTSCSIQFRAFNETTITINCSVQHYIENGTSTLLVLTDLGTDVKPNSTTWDRTTDPAVFSFRELIALNSIRENFNDGNTAFSLTAERLQAPNSTIVTCGTGTGSSQSCYMQVGTWVPDAFRWGGGNRKANSTGFSVSGTAPQTFSFKLQVFKVTVQGRTADGSANTYDNWNLKCTFANSTTCDINSIGTSVTLNYVGNGSNTLTAWWGSSNPVRANTSFSASFTADGNYNFNLNIAQDTGSNFRWAVDKATISAISFTAPDLSFTSSSTDNPQLRLQYLTTNYGDLPTKITHNGTLHNTPGNVSGLIWLHDMAHPNAVLNNVITMRALLGGAPPAPAVGPSPAGQPSQTGALNIGLSAITLTLGETKTIIIPITWTGQTSITLTSITFSGVTATWITILTQLPKSYVVQAGQDSVTAEAQIQIIAPSNVQPGTYQVSINAQGQNPQGIFGSAQSVINLSVISGFIEGPADYSLYAIGAIIIGAILYPPLKKQLRGKI